MEGSYESFSTSRSGETSSILWELQQSRLEEGLWILWEDWSQLWEWQVQRSCGWCGPGVWLIAKEHMGLDMKEGYEGKTVFGLWKLIGRAIRHYINCICLITSPNPLKFYTALQLKHLERNFQHVGTDEFFEFKCIYRGQQLYNVLWVQTKPLIPRSKWQVCKSWVYWNEDFQWSWELWEQNKMLET